MALIFFIKNHNSLIISYSSVLIFGKCRAWPSSTSGDNYSLVIFLRLVTQVIWRQNFQFSAQFLGECWAQNANEFPCQIFIFQRVQAENQIILRILSESNHNDLISSIWTQTDLSYIHEGELKHHFDLFAHFELNQLIVGYDKTSVVDLEGGWLRIEMINCELRIIKRLYTAQWSEGVTEPLNHTLRLVQLWTFWQLFDISNISIKTVFKREHHASRF